MEMKARIQGPLLQPFAIVVLLSSAYCYASGNLSVAEQLNEDPNTGDSILIPSNNDDTTLFAYYTGLNTSLVASIVVSSDDFLESCSNSETALTAVKMINSFLTKSGVPNKSLLTTDEFVLAGLTIVITLLAYYFLMGKNHVKKRNLLAKNLQIAQEKVTFLEDKLMLLQEEDLIGSDGKKREIRIFMDGAFDMMHYGHMNAFRLGRSIGTYLVVGVNSDETITKCKGAPLMNDDERLAMVKGCKFVDEVVEECPYIMNEEYLNHVIEKYDIDFVIHGDDPCIVNGKDVYETAKKAGKYQSIPRTEGVSTTDIVGRMLLMTKDHHCDAANQGGERSQEKDKDGNALLCEQSKFLTTSRMLRLFSTGMQSPKPGMRVIYIDGAWDMFHCGHVSLLEEAKKRGDYLIVGIHNDAVVNRERGCNLPLMNLHERVLSVMGCRHVDDVLIDAPRILTSDMMASLKIDEVVRGVNGDGDDIDNDLDRFKAAIEKRKFTEIKPATEYNLNNIIERIQQNQKTFQAKISKKKKAESEYYNTKYNK